MADIVAKKLAVLGALPISPFPENFPEKGKYRTWDKSWNPTGYADEPQHSGQGPIVYPPDATLLEIQLGGYIVVQEPK